jgi:methionine-rich copper-binding protein CopC
LDTPTIFFDFTIGSFPTAGGNAAQDRFQLFGGSARAGGVSGTSSWLILGGEDLTGLQAGLGANWTFYNGTGDGGAFVGANLVDSGIPLVLGNTYRFTILDDPSTASYTASVYNLNDPAGAFTTTGSLGYRGLAVANPHIHFGASMNNSGDTAGFTVDNVSIVPVAPALVTTVPADNATNVALGANLTATFTESVVAGTGNIELWQVGGGSPVESFNVASSPQLTFSGATLTIDPTASLTSGVEYYILIPATAVVDTTGGDAFAGISDPTAWSFTTDGVAPTLVTVNPADDAPEVLVASNLVATFSEPVIAGTGNIELRQTGGALVESFNVASSPQLTFSGATLTIDPTVNLVPGTGYYVLIGSTAVVDASSIPFAGISAATTWNFTGDGTPPTIASLSPVDDAQNVAANGNLVATFSESVAPGTGNIELWKTGGVSALESFNVTSSPQLTFAGANLTINPTADLDPSTGYYVIIPSTAVVDLSGNAFAGLSGTGAWNFTSLGAVVPITVVNTNGPIGFVQTSPPTINTFSFDAGSTARMLVVTYSAELSSPVANGGVRITYGGFSLTRAISAAGFADIYHLDLSTTSYTGGAADLVVDLSDYVTRNGLSIGAVSLSAGGQPIVLHTTATGGNNAQSVVLNTAASNAFAVASFNSNSSGGTAPAVSAPLTQIYASNNIGSARGAAGYESGVSAGNHTYTWTLPTTDPSPRRVVAASFVAPAAAPTNTFANWISNPVFGLALADQDLGDDPDGDGTGNGVENFFGTNPGTLSQGLLVGIKSGNTFTFTHPQNATPASDLTASYRWSKDLASFLASGATDGAGTTVSFTTQADTPSSGITTVTATVTGTATSNLFVRVNVTQP